MSEGTCRTRPWQCHYNHEIVAADGTSLEVRWYKNAELNPASAVVYLHGGGMICGNLDIYDPLISSYVATTGVPMLAVEYRLAPEHPHPVPVEDSYAVFAGSL